MNITITTITTIKTCTSTTTSSNETLKSHESESNIDCDQLEKGLQPSGDNKKLTTWNTEKPCVGRSDSCQEDQVSAARASSALIVILLLFKYVVN